MTEHTNGLSKRFISVALSFFLAFSLVVPYSTALAEPTAASMQEEADAAKAELEAMQVTLNAASDNYTTALLAQQEAEAKVEEAQRKIDEETARIESLQEQLGDRARSMYRSGTTSFLDFLLGAASFEEFANNLALLDIINQHDADLVQETKTARANLEAAKVELDAQAAAAAEAAAEALQVQQEAAATVAEMQAVYDNLSAEAERLLEEERAAQAAADAEAARQNIASGNVSGGNGAVNNDKVQSVTGNIVVDRAMAELGKPYSWGGVGPSSYDCSGLVGYALTGNHTRWCTTYTMVNWTPVTNPQPGDICISYTHTGIYIGNGQMIHAPTFGQPVQISGVQAGMWYVRY